MVTASNTLVLLKYRLLDTSDMLAVVNADSAAITLALVKYRLAEFSTTSDVEIT